MGNGPEWIDFDQASQGTDNEPLFRFGPARVRWRDGKRDGQGTTLYRSGVAAFGEWNDDDLPLAKAKFQLDKSLRAKGLARLYVLAGTLQTDKRTFEAYGLLRYVADNADGEVAIRASDRLREVGRDIDGTNVPVPSAPPIPPPAAVQPPPVPAAPAPAPYVPTIRYLVVARCFGGAGMPHVDRWSVDAPDLASAETIARDWSRAKERLIGTGCPNGVEIDESRRNE